MKNKYIIAVCLSLVLFSCSVTQLQKKGRVKPKAFHAMLGFETHKGVISLDATVNGESKKLLFDTGADLTIIQSDSLTGRISKFSGASKRKMELGQGTVTSIKIGNIEFQNTYSLNGDMVGLKEQIPGFGGIIGQSIIRKANWLINYPNKQMEVSNQRLDDDSYTEIKILRENGNNPYTYLKVNGKDYKVIIDLGSSSTINLPSDSAFGKDISNSIELSDHTRGRYTLGGLQQITEKIGVIPKVILGSFEFENVDVNINTSSQPRIGVKFFKDYSIYIDNTNGGGYKLKKHATPHKGSITE